MTATGSPSGSPRGWPIRCSRATPQRATLVAPLTDDGAARYDVLWSWIETHTSEDVWYLDVLGVDPSKQGKGIGSALIRFGLERAARDGADAFLETAVEANVAYYERFGFRTVFDGVRRRRRSAHLVHAHRRLTTHPRASANARTCSACSS